MDSMVPTYILESDSLFREGLRLILSRTRFRPHACGVDLQELAAIPKDRPVLFIVGIRQQQHFIARLRHIREQYPASLVVAIGDELHHQFLAAALDAGANAALCSSVAPSGLIHALDTLVVGGITVMDARLWSSGAQPKIEEQAPLPTEDAPPLEPEGEPLVLRQLSTRENAILERIVRGDSNKHVARHFGIAEPTVKAHVKAIFRKIGANNRTQAAIWALHHGLVDSVDGAPQVISEKLARNGSRRLGADQIP